MKEIIQKVQVNIPFWMLKDGYLEKFLDMGLNPEIGMDAQSLDGFSFDEVLAVAKRFRDKGARITVHGPFMGRHDIGQIDAAARSWICRPPHRTRKSGR